MQTVFQLKGSNKPGVLAGNITRCSQPAVLVISQLCALFLCAPRVHHPLRSPGKKRLLWKKICLHLSSTMIPACAKQPLLGITHPAVFPSIVMCPNTRASWWARGRRTATQSTRSKSKHCILTLRYSIEQGIVTNWEDIEKIWLHTLHAAVCGP